MAEATNVSRVRKTPVHSTPLRARVSNYASQDYTHVSVDGFIREDLDMLARKNVPFDTFLSNVLGFEKGYWDDVLRDRHLHNDEEYKQLLSTYLAKAEESEVQSYEPFKNLAHYIVKSVSDMSAETVKDSIDLRLHCLGAKPLNGKFGKRKPDIVGSSGDTEEANVTWNKALFVFEFKRNRSQEKKRKANDEAQTDSLSKKTKAISAKDFFAHHSGQVALARGVVSDTVATNMFKTGKHKHSKFKKNFTIQPGFNIPSFRESYSESDSEPKPEPELSESERDSLISAPLSNDPEVQLANYATQMLSSEDLREWVVSVLVVDNFLTLWYYDRSVAFCSVSIQLQVDHESFIKVILALALCSKDKRKLGWSTLYKTLGDPSQNFYVDAKDFVRVEEKGTVVYKNDIPNVGLEGQSLLRINQKKMIHLQFTLFGRATRVEDVEVGVEKDNKFVCTSGDTGLVLKLSYQVKTRTPEPDIITIARTIDPEHTPAMLGYLILERHLPGEKLEELKDDSILKPREDAYEKRHMVLILMRKYEPVWHLKGEAFMKVFRQAVICHRKFIKNKDVQILHRDLSLQNLRCYQVDKNVWKAVLLDYDLSIILKGERMVNVLTSKHRTGTTPFMARELLSKPPEGVVPEHLYTHDLESWFYILLHVHLGYTDQAPSDIDDSISRPHLLSAWYERNWEKVGAEKVAFFHEVYGIKTHGYFFLKTSFEHSSTHLYLVAACELFLEQGRAVGAAASHYKKEKMLEILKKRTREIADENADENAKKDGRMDIPEGMWWELTHKALLDYVTFESFAQAIGIVLDDVKDLLDD